MKKIYLILPFILPTWLFAIDATTVINSVVNNNLRLKSQSKLTEASSLTNKIQRRTMFPTISLSGGYSHLSDPLTLDLSQARNSVVDGMTQQTIDFYNNLNDQLPEELPSLDPNEVHNSIDKLYPDWNAELSPQDFFLASLTVKQPIFIGGKLLGASKASKNQFNIAKEVEEKEKDVVSLDAVSLYLGVLYGKAQIKLRESSLNAYKEHAKNTKSFINEGVLPSYFSLGAEAAVKLAKVNLEQANSYEEIKVRNLKNRLNISNDSSLDFDDTLHLIELTFTKEVLDSLIIAYSPKLKVNKELQKIAEHNKNIAVGRFFPSVFAVGSVQLYQKNLPVMTPPWMVGVQAQWDIFNGTKDILLSKQAKLAQERGKINYQQSKVEVLERVSNLYSHLLVSKELYLSFVETEKMFEATLRAVKKEYATGRAKSVEVLDAQKRLDEVRLQKLTALYSYTLQLAELYTISGKINTFAEEFDQNEN